MRRLVPLLLLFSLMALPAQEASFAPEHPLSRYQAIWERSPFVVQTAVLESSPLAQRFVLTAVTMLGDQPMIFVLDRKTLQRISLTTEASADGAVLLSVVSNSDPKLVRANIRVGREEGSIGYDLEALQAVNQAAAAPNPSESPAQAAAQSPKPPARIIRRPPINLAR